MLRRRRPTPAPIDGPIFISNRTPTSRPTLTVKEEFDFYNDGDWYGEHDLEVDLSQPDLSSETFDTDSLKVGTRAQSAFAEHHRVTAVRAIEEIRLLARKAITDGCYHRAPNGFHELGYEKFRIRVTPDAEMVTGYWTRHFERMPSQVIAGVKSRFEGQKSKQSRPDEWIPGPHTTQDELYRYFDATTTPVRLRAIAAYARWNGYDKKDPATEGKLRASLAGTRSCGTWRAGDRDGLHLLEDDTWTWVVANDGNVITVWPHDHVQGN